jgi:putative peptidoglycan lipid II flippase
MTAIVPELAALDERGERSTFTGRFLFGLRLIAVVVIPATVGFVLLARPLVQLLLQWRDVEAASVDLTASSIAAFGWGIVGFSAYLYVLRAFYAMKDTRTPFLINVAQNVLTIGFAFLLASDVVTPGGFGVEGLAWSWSAAYTLAAVLAAVVLHRRVGGFGADGAVTAGAVGRLAVAGLVMAGAVWALVSGLDGSSPWLLAIGGGAVGLAVYLGVAIALRVPEVRQLPRFVLRRV